MQLIETQQDTKHANRRLVSRALASLSAPAAGIAESLYAADVRFVGPASALWPQSGAPDPLGLLTNSCLEIERIDAGDERVLTHATLRAASGREARALFVHDIADGRISRVSSVLSWS
jgi:hypothetical protein